MKTDKMDNDTFFEKLKELHTAAEIEELLKQVNPVSAEYMKSKENLKNDEALCIPTHEQETDQN